ncbi:MAG: DnaD domain protein [Lachnospiraceae bacterium]|nr:DnaD domain protein [Lachnospiraceae bacterium]
MEQIIISDKIKPSTTTISNEFIDTYMAKANGEYVKVFLMLLRFLQGEEDISAKLVAERLDMTERAVMRALSYWEKEGLISLPAASPISAARENAEESQPKKSTLTPADLRKKQSDKNFSHLKYITEVYLGHPMTNPEINSLSYIYDELKLPVELIEYLIEYCVSNHKTSLRYMEKVAIDWHQKGIRTLRQAKAQSASYNKDYYTIMKAMGLKNNPAPAQIEFMDQWIYKDGYSMNLILEACKRTITAIGKPSFPYTAKILASWKKAGIKSPDEIAAYDRQQNHKKSASTTKTSKKPNFQQRTYDFDALTQRYIEKINQ